MTNQDSKANGLGTAAALATATVVAAGAAEAAEAEDKLLAGLRSDDEDANYAAWSTAEQADPSVIPAVSELLVSKKPNVRKAAEEALKNIVHAVGKTIDPRNLGANTGRPDDPGRMDRRQQVVMHLKGLVTGKRQEIEKVTALRHLSLIATTDDVGAIAALIHDPRLREEVAFCLERIPGKAAEEALLSALAGAADDFKPRILAALGHRQADEAVDACVAAMGSADQGMAMAGMKAWARIGTSTGEEIDFPDMDDLSAWEKVEFSDSMLRYADAQVEKGNTEEGERIYREALDSEEGHMQCAGIVGLAKIGTSAAAAAIFPKLSSADSTVRITAQQAWDRLGQTG